MSKIFDDNNKHEKHNNQAKTLNNQNIPTDSDNKLDEKVDEILDEIKMQQLNDNTDENENTLKNSSEQRTYSFKNTNKKNCNKKTKLQVKNSKLKNKVILIVSIAVLIIGLIFTAAWAIDHYKRVKEQNQLMMDVVNVNTFYEGVTIMGVDLTGQTVEQAKVSVTEALKEARPQMDIICKYQDVATRLTEDDFIFTYNTDEVLKEAYSVARSGVLKERYENVLNLKENPMDFKVTATLQKDNLETATNRVAEDVYLPYKDAQIISFIPELKISEGVNGRELDINDFQNKLSLLLNEENLVGEIPVNVIDIEYKVSKAQLKKEYGLISTYSTVSTNTANANNNMKISLKAIDGKYLKPGEVFSFNGCTGNSNLASLGYLPADAIYDGKVVKQNGGGICQSATTVYAAALRANMTIVERYNHQFPSSYIPIGLDATISYPSADLKFRNDFDTPVYIHTYMSGTKLTCEFYGKKSSEYDNITTSSWVSLKNDQGVAAKAVRIFYKNGKEIKKEELPSSYYKNKK